MPTSRDPHGARALAEPIDKSPVGAPDSRTALMPLRVRVAVHRSKLTYRLARGADPDATDELALRARQLLYPEQRRAVAAVLRNILDAAEAASSSTCSGRRAEVSAVIGSRDRLVRLIDSLRGGAPMTAAAVAAAELLACDRNSPLVSPRGGQAIHRALDEIPKEEIADLGRAS